MSLFKDQLYGNFRSALRWPDLDALWHSVKRSNAEWYIYTVGKPVPRKTSSHDQLEVFLDEIRHTLRDRHEEDFCGIVYADDHDMPTMIKIYDPDNLGVVCGYSEKLPLPGWILTQSAPEDIAHDVKPVSGLAGWLRRMFHPGSHHS